MLLSEMGSRGGLLFLLQSEQDGGRVPVTWSYLDPGEVIEAWAGAVSRPVDMRVVEKRTRPTLRALRTGHAGGLFARRKAGLLCVQS